MARRGTADRRSTCCAAAMSSGTCRYAGALTASFQNLDDTILIEWDSYAHSETYAAGNGRSDHRRHRRPESEPIPERGEVQALIAAALVPYWNQGEVSSFVAGELANYATSSSVTSAISSVLSSYDGSSQVDSKIVTALLDFYTHTQTEVDQQITNALENVDLSSYYTQAKTQSYVANELGVLPSDQTRFPAYGHVHPVLDQLADPDRDR